MAAAKASASLPIAGSTEADAVPTIPPRSGAPAASAAATKPIHPRAVVILAIASSFMRRCSLREARGTMTPGVNSLTDRARTPRPPAVRNPQLLSSFRPFLDAFEKLGADRTDLMRAAGLTKQDFEDPDAVVSDAACMALFGEAGRVCAVPNFGLRVAERIPIGTYPLLDYLVMTAENVGEVFSRLAKYLRVVGSPSVLSIHDQSDPVVVRLAPTSTFNAEFTLSLAVLDLRLETDGGFRPASLSLRHRPDDPEDFEKRVGCPIRFHAESDELAIPRSVWRLPMRRRDSVLHSVLQRQADEMLARLGSGDGTAAQLRRALVDRISGGDTSLTAVARSMGSSARTLQRRLDDEGTSYQEVLDGVRRDAAEQYLSSPTLSCAEVGYLLGFSEPAAFHRAFKRWRGVTPNEYRRRIRSKP
jgi:AraC-like DNA-binding protein